MEIGPIEQRAGDLERFIKQTAQDLTYSLKWDLGNAYNMVAIATNHLQAGYEGSTQAALYYMNVAKNDISMAWNHAVYDIDDKLDLIARGANAVIFSLADGIVNRLASISAMVIEAVNSAISPLQSLILGTSEMIVKSLKENITSLAEFITTIYFGILQNFQDKISRILDIITPLIVKMETALTGIIEAIPRKIMEAIRNLFFEEVPD